MSDALKRVFVVEQHAADVPVSDGWLSSGELRRCSTLRIAKRRLEWRLGRWTAKVAVASRLHVSDFASIDIVPAASGAPEVFIADGPTNFSISISHRDGTAVCAITAKPCMLGCDLEQVEPRSPAFLRDYFTEAERQFIRDATRGMTDDTGGRNLLANLIWSAKESVLKATQEGLRRDTRDVEITVAAASVRAVAPGKWHRFSATLCGNETFYGWFTTAGDLVTTVATNAPFPEPRAIEVEALNRVHATRD